MKFPYHLLLLILIANFTYLQKAIAQQTERSISYERNDDNSITFTFNNSIPESVYVVLKFDQLSNTTAGVIKKNVSGFTSELVTLFPDNPKNRIGFTSYSYRTLTGNINAKPDMNFKYALPVKSGNEIKVRNLGYLGNRFGNTEPKNWKSFQFLTKPNDTIYAIRKGIVVKTNDGERAETREGRTYGYRNKSNSIIIEHEDGTIAKYDVLKNNSFMVNIGDTVYPSTPLAIAGSYDTDENSQLRLMIYYLDNIVKDLDFDAKSKEKFGNTTHIYAYVNPMFYVNSNGSEVRTLNDLEAYTAYCDSEIIQFEMRKREKKRWLKSKALKK